MNRRRYYELMPSTKKAEKYRLFERATKAHYRRVRENCESDIPANQVVGDVGVWQGRQIVLFTKDGKYITEYRWYPKTDTLRRWS
jgi:hypothetical protein